MVINAQSGVEVVSRRMMEYAKDRNLPRAVVINKCDLASTADGSATLRGSRAGAGGVRRRNACR